MKMHYTIYKITNLLNNMIYIGQHRTYDINDNYMGSGILISNVVKKYGVLNFRKDILFDFDTFEEMNAKEGELVNVAFVERSDTYNLTVGGYADKGYSTRGKKLVNNGIEQKMVHIANIPLYINEGWELGAIESTYPGLSKGNKWIRNLELNEQHLVKDELAQKYLALPGWEFGQIPHEHPKLPMLSEKFTGYRILNKNDIEIHIPPQLVDVYLLDGWELGSRKSLAKTLWKHYSKDMQWMHKDNLFEKRIHKNEIEQYLNDGWMFGRLFHKQSKRNSITEEQKEFMRQLWTGSKFMNDGTITRQIRKNDIDLFLALGWKFGGLNNQNRIYVNNGIINHNIKKDDLQSYLDLGFKRGKLKNYKTKSQKGYIFIHNIETHKNSRIGPNDLIPAGYEEGLYIDEQAYEKLSNRTKGNKYIINDFTDEVAHIKQGDPLPDGWHFGRHKRNLTDEQRNNIHKKASERTWYTNGENNAMVPWGKEQEYIDAGWWKGRSNFHKHQTKTIGYTNGEKNILIDPKDEQYYINLGWHKGRTLRH